MALILQVTPTTTFYLGIKIAYKRPILRIITLIQFKYCTEDVA